MDVNTTQSSNSNYVVGFFNNYSDAENAIHDLTEAGIPANRIGVAAEESESASGTTREHEGFWHKIVNFFEGKEDGAANDRSAIDPGLSRYANHAGHGVVVSVSTISPEERQEAEDILEQHGAELEGPQVALSAEAVTDGNTTGHRLQLLSEVLRVHKDRVSRGEVRLRKEVITENQSIEVPVSREELVIERRPVQDGAVASGEIGANQEIRVPLSEDQVRVEKRPVVKEEVKVGKRNVQKTRRVNEQVKREELHVENEGDVRPGRKKDIA
jgi:uncharacterized protein (TIGR02271 family)